MMIQFLVLLAGLQTARSNLNLYLSQGEVRRLLGLENELFYVRDGTINQYAIGFVIPIPTSVDILNFSWYLSSPILPLHYKLTFGSSDTEIISEPTVNISTVGTIPTSPQVQGQFLDIHLIIHSFNISFIHDFMLSFNYSFIHLSIHPFSDLGRECWVYGTEGGRNSHHNRSDPKPSGREQAVQHNFTQL